MRGLRNARVGGCHDLAAVRFRTEKIDRMSIDTFLLSNWFGLVLSVCMDDKLECRGTVDSG